MTLFRNWRLASLICSAFLALVLVAPTYAQEGQGRGPAQQEGTLTIHGFAWFDSNNNGQRDNSEPMLSNVLVSAQAGRRVTQATTQADGTYTLTVGSPGPYTLEATLSDLSDPNH